VFNSLDASHWLLSFTYDDGSDEESNIFDARVHPTTSDLYVAGYGYNGTDRSIDSTYARITPAGSVAASTSFGTSSDDRLTTAIDLDSANDIVRVHQLDNELSIQSTKSDFSDFNWQHAIYPETDSFFDPKNAVSVGSNYYVASAYYDALGECFVNFGAIAANGNVSFINNFEKTTNPGQLYLSNIRYNSTTSTFFIAAVDDNNNTVVDLLEFNTSGAKVSETEIDLSASLGSVDNIFLEVDSAGNVYVYAGGGEITTFDGIAALIKFNSSKVKQWENKFSGDYVFLLNEMNSALAENSSGNLVVIVGAEDYTANFEYFAWLELNPTTGALISERSIAAGIANDFNYIYPHGVVADGTSLYLYGAEDISNGNFWPWWAFVAKVPDDGTLTGTYGDFTYAATSVVSVSALTASTVTATTTWTGSTFTPGEPNDFTLAAWSSNTTNRVDVE
jgi:hypothetical protein